MGPRTFSLSAILCAVLVWLVWVLLPSAELQDRGQADHAEPPTSSAPAAATMDPERIVSRTTVPGGPIDDPAPAKGADEEGHMLTVRVLTAEEEDPVPDTHIFLMDDAQPRVLGITDADGVAQVLVPEQGPAILVAHRAGMPEARGSFRDAAPQEMVLRLGAGEVLDGRVVGRGGVGVEGVRVMALFDRSRPTTEELRACALGQPSRVPYALSEPGGGFRIEGLRPGARYRLKAGGQGVLSEARGSASFTTADSPAVVEVFPVYAGVLRVRDADGHRPEASPDSLFMSWQASQESMVYKTHCEADSVDLLLCGVDGAAWIDDPDFDRIALAAWREEDPLDPSWDLFLDLSGYERTTETLRVAQGVGTLPVTEVRLQPWARPTGSLTVHFASPPPPFQDHKVLPHFGDLLITCQEPKWHRYFPVRDLSRPLVASGLPAGEISYFFYFSQRFVSDQRYAGTVLVGAEATEVTIDLSDWGSMTLVPARADGALHGGLLGVALQWSEGRRTEELWFGRPPYQSKPIPAGQYKVKLLSPLPEGGRPAPELDLKITAGQQKVVDLPLE